MKEGKAKTYLKDIKIKKGEKFYFIFKTRYFCRRVDSVLDCPTQPWHTSLIHTIKQIQYRMRETCKSSDGPLDRYQKWLTYKVLPIRSGKKMEPVRDDTPPLNEGTKDSV